MPVTAEIYLAIIFVLIAGVLRGFSGFGAGLILVPSLSVIYSPIVAVATVVLLEIIPSIQLLPRAIKKCHWQSVAPMALMAAIAIPFGSLILVYTDADTMRIVISALVILCVLILAMGWRFKGEFSSKVSVSTGLVSGVISGATSLGGLPVILFYLSNKHSTEVARASIVMFLVVTTIIALITYVQHGIITTEVVVRSASLGPFFIIAIWVGGKLFGKVSESVFRSITLALLGSVGLAMLFA